MEIYVLGREKAEERVAEKIKEAEKSPEKRDNKKIELMIGILNSKWYKNSPNNVPIGAIPLNMKYLTYKFDDITEEFQDYVLINQKIAREMIDDISRIRDEYDIKALSVHCRAGLSRSSAVAAALNDSFSLGRDSEEFFSGQHTPNRIVYITIFRAAKEMGICEEYFWR